MNFNATPKLHYQNNGIVGPDIVNFVTKNGNPTHCDNDKTSNRNAHAE